MTTLPPPESYSPEDAMIDALPTIPTDRTIVEDFAARWGMTLENTVMRLEIMDLPKLRLALAAE